MSRAAARRVATESTTLNGRAGGLRGRYSRRLRLDRRHDPRRPGQSHHLAIAAAAIASSNFSSEFILGVARAGKSVINGLRVFQWVALVAFWTGVVSLLVLLAEPDGRAGLAAVAVLVSMFTYLLASTYLALHSTANSAGLRAQHIVQSYNAEHGHNSGVVHQLDHPGRGSTSSPGSWYFVTTVVAVCNW